MHLMMKTGYFLSSIILTALMLFGFSSYNSVPFNEQLTFEEEDAEFNDDLESLAFDFQLDGGGDGGTVNDSQFLADHNKPHSFSCFKALFQFEIGRERARVSTHQPFYILFCELKIDPVSIL